MRCFRPTPNAWATGPITPAGARHALRYFEQRLYRPDRRRRVGQHPRICAKAQRGGFAAARPPAGDSGQCLAQRWQSGSARKV